MKRYKYIISNLDCANCARRVEEELNKNELLDNVIVNFSTSKLSFSSEQELPLEKINALVKAVEPDASVSKEEKEEQKGYSIYILLIALVFGLLGMDMDNTILRHSLMLLSYSLLLYKPFLNACKLLIKSKTINENALITISCIGAYVIGEHMEGMMVIALYMIGKILEEKAIHHSRNSIKDILDIKQNFANIKKGTKVNTVDVSQIRIKDTLVVKKGERIPVDGIVKEGSTFLDTSCLTGESEYTEVSKNEKVLSGCINVGEVIVIEATSTFENSTVARILELVEDASDKKAKTETFVAKASKVYTPCVLLLAILVTILLPLLTSLPFIDSLYRGLTFLVISCPCAIAISVPLSYFTGIGISSKNGILIKGSNYLDHLNAIDQIIFDKTGTLTSGTFQVTEITIDDSTYTKKEVIDLLVKGEALSNHPIAKSICKLKSKKIDSHEVKNFKEIEGKGISYCIGNKKIKVGNAQLCKCGKEAALHINIDGKHIASITMDDGIKEEALSCITELKNNNIKTFMFTGDKKEIALAIGKKLGIDQINYEMLPTDKYSAYEKVSSASNCSVFVGDGINDAPVLKRADIGISMGNIGSESAIEASDIVLMSDDLSKLPLAISISKYTKFIIKQNLLFAIFVKLIILLLSIVGLANMWFAVFADTGVTLLTILNTLRIMRKYK